MALGFHSRDSKNFLDLGRYGKRRGELEVQLPVEIWDHIIGMLDFTSLCSASGVSKSWNQMALPRKVPRLFMHLHHTIGHKYETARCLPPDDVPEISPPLLAFATLPKSIKSSSLPHAVVHFPYYNHTVHWPLPAPLTTIQSSKGFFCGLISPTFKVPGQGFRFIVTSHSISSSTSWAWEHLPPTEYLRYTHADHLPYRVRFVAGCKNNGYYVVVVPEEQAKEIEVYSSERGTWTHHLRGDTSTYVHVGFEGHIPIGVVRENSRLLALSFNPVSNAWGCRPPFPRPLFSGFLPDLGKPIYEYFGYGEGMLAGTFVARVKDGKYRGALAIVAEKREPECEIMNREMLYPWRVHSCGLMNVSTSGGTVCYQWFNKDEDSDRCACHFNKYDVDPSGSRTWLNTSDKAFLLTCCE